MNSMNKSEFVRLGVNEMKKAMPVIITAEGEPIGVLVDLNDIIVLTDLNINIRRNLRAQEMKARAGMPPVQKLEITAVRTEV